MRAGFEGRHQLLEPKPSRRRAGSKPHLEPVERDLISFMRIPSTSISVPVMPATGNGLLSSPRRFLGEQHGKRDSLSHWDCADQKVISRRAPDGYPGLVAVDL